MKIPKYDHFIILLIEKCFDVNLLYKLWKYNVKALKIKNTLWPENSLLWIYPI